MKIVMLITILSMISCVTTSRKKEFKYKPVTKELLERVKQEEKTGEIIYQKDSYAWYASDYLTEQDLYQEKLGLKGWVVDLKAKNPSVIFMSMNNDIPVAKLVVHPSETGSVHYFPENTEQRHADMFKARNMAINNTQRMCNGNYNTVIIEAEGNWIVYLLVAPLKANTLFAGGNYKITISKANFKIIESQALSKTCFAMPFSTDKKSWPMMTHLVEPFPNAVHAFLSLQNNLEYFVVTDTGLWEIANGKISYIQGKE